MCKVIVWAFVLLLPLSILAQQWNYAANYSGSSAGADRGVATATDASGNLYVVGAYIGEINFGTGLLPNASASNGFVAKFSPSGTCLWAVGFASAGNDQVNSVTTDGTAVYIGGNFAASITVPPLSTVTGSGAITGFIAKLNASNGQGQWVKTIDGTNTENVQALCLDGSGNLFASGIFNTTASFGGQFTRNANGGSSTDMFVAKLAPGDGSFAWVSTGGALSNTDFPQYSGMAYVAAIDQLVLTGSYNSATATYATVAPAAVSSVSITNAGLLDICFIKVNAANGAFVSATGVGGSGNDDGISLVYDPSTQDILATGYFGSPSITFGSNPALPNEGNNDVWYTRFNPATNNFVWSKAAGSNGGAADRPYDIATNNSGSAYIIGTFRGTFDIPTTLLPLAISTTNAADDIFLARINAADGNGQLLAQGANALGATVSNIGYSVILGTGNNVWTTGSFSGTVTFSPQPAITSTGGTADIFIARYSDPSPLTANPTQTAANCSVGCNGTATVTPSGGVGPYTYLWSTGSTTASITGLCPGAMVSVTVTDALGSTVTQNFTITPTSQLASATAFNTSFNVSATNTYIYDAGCNLIARLVPNGGGTQVTGSVSAKVWKDASVQKFTYPYVQRHYEIMPATNATTATARVTLYFTQAEFNTFNAYPGLTALLPTGPADAGGKANVRFSKFPGTSNNNTGAPGSYPLTGGSVIDPVDADIVWNATNSRWEISFNVTGFSGFFLQTSQALLPLTWLSLNGVLNDAGKAVISWKVQEQQVAGYTIERSTDGANYTAAGSLASQGDGEHTYQFEEATALAGKASYRVKQTDLDGRSTYSKVLHLQSDRRGWVSLYPNPVRNTATLNVTDKELINTTAVLYDGTGRVLQRILITQSMTTISMDKYNRGVYTLRLKDGQSIRIVKE